MSEKIRVLLVALLAVLLRCGISYHPYSGQGKPPMYGDYEAQRHWQEITLNLPTDQWYSNTTDNDLEYWGLDYPPLTAYHSFLIGSVANRTNPDFVKLFESRGYESDDHKYFMRLSVLQSDLLIYIPAVIWFVSKLNIKEPTNLRSNDLNIFGLGRRDFVLATILIYPGLMLIDHGHFQYNCVSLGLFVAAVTAILQNLPLVSSFLFVLALNYKQMELYHALPFFFYILGINIPGKDKSLRHCVTKLTYVALTVMLTFAITWTPFIQDWNTFLDAVSRLFPVARGVFEDKVANVWCAVNVVHKLRDSFTNIQMAKVCLVATLTAVLPSCMDLLLRPSREKFQISLINAALGFFLFSFQVHEKSILLVAIPVLLHFANDPLPCFWFLVISNFSMLPLLIKDNLLLAYFASNLFYAISVGWMFSDMFHTSLFKGKQSDRASKDDDSRNNSHVIAEKHLKRKSISVVELDTYNDVQVSSEIDAKSIKISRAGYELLVMGLFYVSMLGMVLLILGTSFMRAPEKYPDIWSLSVSIYSCSHFLIFFLYFNYKQFCISGQNYDIKIKSN